VIVVTNGIFFAMTLASHVYSKIQPGQSQFLFIVTLATMWASTILVWHHLYISKPNFETHLACTIIAEFIFIKFGAETFSSNIHAVFIHSNKTDL
jgi:hypothetical protein